MESGTCLLLHSCATFGALNMTCLLVLEGYCLPLYLNQLLLCLLARCCLLARTFVCFDSRSQAPVEHISRSTLTPMITNWRASVAVLQFWISIDRIALEIGDVETLLQNWHVDTYPLQWTKNSGLQTIGFWGTKVGMIETAIDISGSIDETNANPELNCLRFYGSMGVVK